MARKKKGFRDPLFDPDPALFSPPASECWFGICLRAPTSHGRVAGLVHPPLPEGFVLIPPGEIPGHGLQVLKARLPLLPEQVHYVGEPLALLAGPDEHAVRALASQVRFVVLPGASELTPGLSRTVQRGEEIPPDQLPADCRVIESTTSSGAQDHGRFDALEVVANVADVARIRVRSQWPAHVVQSVARALDLDPTQVQVMATTTAGLTGGQVWFPSLYSVYAAVLSRACGRPVLMRLTRQEDFHHSPKRPECSATLRSVVTAEGRILSLTADVVVQVGAWPVMAEELLDRALVGLLTPYHLDHFFVQGTAMVSATPPRGPVGSNGEAMGLFALENHVQDICRELDLDPLKWRMANAVAKDQPWFTGLVPKTENPLRALMNEVARVTDFSRKQAAFQLLAQSRSRLVEEELPLRGIGVASGFQGNGFLAGGSPVHLEGRLEENGQLSLYIPLVTPNPRLTQLWKESAAALLQIPTRDIRICPVFSGDQPIGGPSFASRAFEIIPRLLVQACEALAQKRFRQPLPLTVRSVYRRNKGPAWDSDEFTGQPFLSLSWCGAVAEVQVIPHRAEVEIVRLSLVVDAGPRIDEAAARNALVEGVQMAVGWTLTEALGWDQGGVDTGLGRYRLPGPRELPPIEIRFFENAREARPRGLGNLGAHAVAPALLGAIRQALGQSTSLSSIPVSRKMLDEALRQGGAAR